MLFLGDDLLAFLALALGGALFAGNLMAIVRPPQRPADHIGGEDERLERAPLARSLVYGGIGLLVAIWALATLIAG